MITDLCLSRTAIRSCYVIERGDKLQTKQPSTRLVKPVSNFEPPELVQRWMELTLTGVPAILSNLFWLWRSFCMVIGFVQRAPDPECIHEDLNMTGIIKWWGLLRRSHYPVAFI
jgi:hypothetical protein